MSEKSSSDEEEKKSVEVKSVEEKKESLKEETKINNAHVPVTKTQPTSISPPTLPAKSPFNIKIISLPAMIANQGTIIKENSITL